MYNIKYISNNVFIIFVWTKECDFILTISWFRQQCYCVGYALLFWCVVSFVYMRVRHFYCNFFFKVCKWLIHSLCIISMHRPLVISLDKEMFHWYFFGLVSKDTGHYFCFKLATHLPWPADLDRLLYTYTYCKNTYCYFIVVLCNYFF